MSYMLPHLHNGWQVDQAILSEEDRVVVSNRSRFKKTLLRGAPLGQSPIRHK